MTAKGRHLKLNMRGDGVLALHQPLTKLGVTLPQGELDASRFGKVTRAAIVELQAADRLDATGTVDEATAQRIDDRIAALTAPEFVVSGRVTHSLGVL